MSGCLLALTYGRLSAGGAAMITRILLAIALAVIATPLRAENQQIWSFDTAGWEGGAYQSTDGRFSHCSISAGYKSGISLALDRKTGGPGKSVSVRVDIGGRRLIK